MSPSEDELRAALHAGEGAGVDADAAIMRARATRRTRRIRFAGVAAAVLVVGGVAAGVTALSGGGPGAPAAQPGADATGTAPNRSAVTATSGPSRPTSTTQTPSSTPVACPPRPANLMLPGGGGTGQFGAEGPIFAAPVTSLTACAYLPDGTRATSFTGGVATSIAESLNGAEAAGRRMYSCAVAMPERVLMLQAPGQPAVVIRIRCGFDDNWATNGTAVRYNWAPPAGAVPGLSALLGMTITPPPSG